MDETNAFDLLAPLERIAGESLRANSALHDYALMGPGRSQRKLLEKYRQMRTRSKAEADAERPPTVQLTRIAEWSTRFQWQERVAAYERLLDHEEEELWKARRKALRNSEWEMQDRLIGLANQIIDAAPDFISEKTVMSEDGSTTVFKKLDGWLAVKAAETGSDLGRRSAGMEKETTKVEHSGLLDVSTDYAKIDDEQLERIIANLIAAATERSPGDGPDGESTPTEPAPDESSGETIEQA